MRDPGGLRSDLGSRTWDASAWLPVLGIAVAIGLLVAGGCAAYSARQDAWRLAEQQSNNLRLALARDIARNITLLDLSLQGAIEALQEPGIDKTTPGIRRQALFDRAAGAEFLGSVVVLGPDGSVTDSSTALPQGLSFACRPEFMAQAQHPYNGLFLSRASKGWFEGDESSISLSRRLPTSNGQFIGVVAVSLRLSYFQHLFEKIDVGPEGSITLLRNDGHVIWRYPAKDGDIDRELGGEDLLRRLATVSEGQFTGPSAIDGVTRLSSFGRVGSLPLVLSINFSVRDIFAHWRQKAAIIGPVLALMAAAIVGLSLLFRREMLRRATAEAALARLAATDVLTGLANRRAFEEALEREWRRAFRELTELSLLMIDVDHFKSFNDRYGHQAGDRTLEAVGRALATNLRRTGDLAARYGGEEFIVLLPGCSALGAKNVGERIRLAIESLCIPHIRNSEGRVTVSIGLATASPATGIQVSELVKVADDELYLAKSAGRNRVSAFAELSASALRSSAA